jgi:hypothetical protein
MTTLLDDGWSLGARESMTETRLAIDTATRVVIDTVTRIINANVMTRLTLNLMVTMVTTATVVTMIIIITMIIGVTTLTALGIESVTHATRSINARITPGLVGSHPLDMDPLGVAVPNIIRLPYQSSHLVLRSIRSPPLR